MTHYLIFPKYKRNRSNFQVIWLRFWVVQCNRNATLMIYVTERKSTILRPSNLRHTRSWRWYLMERLALAMWCLQVTPRCIDMAQETRWMNEWSPKACSWQLKNHHYNKLKFGETERESFVYSSTEVFVPRDMSDLAKCWQISNTRTKSGALIYSIHPPLLFPNLILLKSKFL